MILPFKIGSYQHRSLRLNLPTGQRKTVFLLFPALSQPERRHEIATNRHRSALLGLSF